MKRIIFLSFMLFLNSIPWAEAQVSKSPGESTAIISQGQNTSPAGGNAKNSASSAATAGSGQNANLAEVDSGEKFARLVWDTVTKSNVFAKTVGDSLTEYVKEQQVRARQQEILNQFYLSCQETMQPMHLSAQDARELLERVEQVYIEDGETGAHRLDVRTFRDLPNVIRKEYGEMNLSKTRDGIVTTYYPGGTLKARWQYQDGKPEGPVVTYYENGEILYIDYYQKGDKISRRKYNPEGKLEFEQAYQYGPVSEASAVSSTEKENASVPIAKPAVAENVD